MCLTWGNVHIWAEFCGLAGIIADECEVGLRGGVHAGQYAR